MEIKRYDRFKRGDEVIEATGLRFKDIGGTWSSLFKFVNPAPGREKDEITFYTLETLGHAGFEKISNRVSPHALISEIDMELKANPHFIEKLIEFLVLAFLNSGNEDKNKIFRLLKKHAPPEYLAIIDNLATFRG